MDPGPDQVPSGRKRKCYVIINDGSEEVKKVVVPYSEDATVRELQDEIMRRCDFFIVFFSACCAAEHFPRNVAPGDVTAMFFQGHQSGEKEQAGGCYWSHRIADRCSPRSCSRRGGAARLISPFCDFVLKRRGSVGEQGAWDSTERGIAGSVG